jgi:hypothetical protein
VDVQFATSVPMAGGSGFPIHEDDFWIVNVTLAIYAAFIPNM